MADAETFDSVSEEMDISDEEMQKIREALNKFMNKEMPRGK